MTAHSLICWGENDPSIPTAQFFTRDCSGKKEDKGAGELCDRTETVGIAFQHKRTHGKHTDSTPT